LCIDCKEEREKEEQAQSMAIRGTAGASVPGGPGDEGGSDESSPADD
jgi:hypothetical protein